MEGNQVEVREDAYHRVWWWKRATAAEGRGKGASQQTQPRTRLNLDACETPRQRMLCSGAEAPPHVSPTREGHNKDLFVEKKTLCWVAANGGGGGKLPVCTGAGAERLAECQWSFEKWTSFTITGKYFAKGTEAADIRL